MSLAAATLSPEVEHLLQEIAADPDSTLFRVERHPPTHHPLDLQEAITPRFTGLTIAERQLVRAYREEVADVLLLACRESILKNAMGRLQFLGNTGTPQQPRDDLRLLVRRRAISSSTDSRSGSAPPSVRSLLSSLSTSPITGVGQSLRLAASSLRLRPNEFARLYYGLASLVEMRNASAAQVLASVATRAASASIRANAWNAHAKALLRLGRTRAAVTSLHRARQTDETYVLPLIGLLQRWIEAGMCGNALRVAHEVDSMILEANDTIKETISILILQKRADFWIPSSPDQHLVRILIDRGNTPSAAIARLYAC